MAESGLLRPEHSSDLNIPNKLRRIGSTVQDKKCSTWWTSVGEGNPGAWSR